MDKIETNKKFSEENEFFKKCCDKTNIPATKRQASKFRNKKGLAYKNRIRAKNNDDKI